MSFHSLPVEIIGEILEKCVSDAQTHVENPDLLLRSIPCPSTLVRSHIACTPWRLSHVCSLWRELCISNPSFWTYLGVTMYNDKDRYAASFQRLRTQLERAGAEGSLSIAINIPPWCKPDQEILDFFKSTAQRWRAAYVCEPYGSFLSRLIPTTPAGLANLKTLCMSRRTTGRVVAPNMKTLLVEIASVAGMRTDDLKSVTSLSIFAPSGSFALALTTQFLQTFIPCFSALTHLSLLGHAIQNEMASSHLTFTALRSLTLGGLDGHGAPEFLNNFTLPGLHTLRLGRISEDCLNFHTLLAFIQRSGCQLQHLSTWPSTLQSNVIDECTTLLRSMPELRTLEFDGPGAETFYLESFLPAAFPKGKIRLVPQLQCVTVGLQKFDVDALRQVSGLER